MNDSEPARAPSTETTGRGHALARSGVAPGLGGDCGIASIGVVVSRPAFAAWAERLLRRRRSSGRD